MRFHNGATVAAALVLATVGCAKPRPCAIIPMQLELVRFQMRQLDKQVGAKTGEVTSLHANVDMARTRFTQLQQESAELEKAIEAAKADSSATGRKK